MYKSFIETYMDDLTLNYGNLFVRKADQRSTRMTRAILDYVTIHALLQ